MSNSTFIEKFKTTAQKIQLVNNFDYQVHFVLNCVRLEISCLVSRLFLISSDSDNSVRRTLHYRLAHAKNQVIYVDFPGQGCQV